VQRSKNDVWVGLFVLIGAAAILFLALQAANLLNLSFQSTYRLSAKFDNVGALKPKAAVRSGGVVVGRVEAVPGKPLCFPQGQLLENSDQRPAR
jgi:phospholipid/cholesterol/gamma-HCH transport system substrate-binding protein